jgi:hypothetical protein
MTKNNHRDQEPDNIITTQIAQTVRRSLSGWGPTLRLCLLGITAATLWGGLQVLEQSLAAAGPNVCIATPTRCDRDTHCQPLPGRLFDDHFHNRALDPLTSTTRNSSSSHADMASTDVASGILMASLSMLDWGWQPLHSEIGRGRELQQETAAING